MKRALSLLLILCLALTMSSCAGEVEKDVRFYYLRTGESIRYGSADALIALARDQGSRDDASVISIRICPYDPS